MKQEHIKIAKFRSFLIVFTILLAGLTTADAHCRLKTSFAGKEFQPGEQIKIEWEIEIEHNQEGWDLFYSTDNGQNWEPINTGMPVEQVSYDWTVPEAETSTAQVRIVQDNSGYDYDDISGTFSIGIRTANDNTPGRPSTGLKIFPNPVMDIARINFDLPAADQTDLSIFDLTGQKVRTVLHKFLGSGSHTVNYPVSELAPGLYFLQLKAEAYRKTRRMVVY